MNKLVFAPLAATLTSLLFLGQTKWPYGVAIPRNRRRIQ